MSTKDNPKIWVFEKNSRKGVLKKTEKTFTSRHIYTFKSSDGANHDYSLEISLSRLEDEYVKIFENKIRQMKPLSSEEHIIVCAFVAAMLLRTERFKANIEDFIDRITDKIELIETGHNLPPIKSAEYRNLQRNVHKLTVKDMLLEITDILYHMNLSLFFVDSTAKNVFITSDDPCNLFNSDLQWQNFIGYGLGQSNIQLTMPLSPHFEICFCWAELRGCIKVSNARVTEHNRMIRGMCYKEFVANSPKVRTIWYSRYPADMRFIIFKLIPNLLKRFINKHRVRHNVRKRKI